MNELGQKERGFSIDSFLGGLAAGVAAFAILMGASSVISEQSASSVKTEETESVLSEEVEEKIALLEELVDTLYLNDSDTEAMAEGIYKGLIDALDDPYSVYYDEEEAQALTESIDGTYSGIGATLSQNADTLALTVVHCFDDTPASEAGLQPGDIIVAVDGTEVTGMDTSSAVALIKGEEGSEVTLTIYREGETDYLTVVLERRQIDIPTVASTVLDGNIGYIQVTSFDEVTGDQFAEAYEEMLEAEVDALIVDLRDNPGGRLDTVCDIAELFVSEGLIVYTEDKDGNRTEYLSESSEDEVFGKPLAVLVNGDSASASEIFAGAVQDRGVGTIVGTTTYGKGVVQQLLDLQDGTMLKLTVSKYFTPNGNDIQGIGVTPDVEVELDEALQTQSSISLEEDNQLQEAIEVLQEEME